MASSNPNPTDDSSSIFSTSTQQPLLASQHQSQAAEYSFTGQPLARHHKESGNPSSALRALGTADAGFAGGAAGAAGANVAPPRFDGGRTVKVPVRKADYGQQQGADDGGKKKKPGLFSLGGGKKKDDGFVMVEMSSAEYRAHWAKGDDGKWLEGVTEPPGGRAEWVRARLEGK